MKNEETKYIVYGLYTEGENRPFYIGKTYRKDNTYRNRFNEHKSAALNNEKSHLYNKIRALERQNINWYLRVIKEFNTHQEALDTEVLLISLMGRKCLGTGYLYNTNPGGELGSFGLRGLRKPDWTEEELEDIKNLYLIEKQSCNKIAKKYGKNHVTILNALKCLGIPRRSLKEAAHIGKLFENRKEEYKKTTLSMKEDYDKNNLTIEEVSKKYGISWSATRIRLKVAKSNMLGEQK